MVRTKRQRQRSRRGGGGSLLGMNNSGNYDGNGETITGLAWRHGSNAVSEIGNKVSGYWNNNNKLPQSQSSIEEPHEPFSGNGRNWVWDNTNRRYEDKATGDYLDQAHGLIYDRNGIDGDGNYENGRSASRYPETPSTKKSGYSVSGTRARSTPGRRGGKRTRRKTKRRRH